MKRHEVDVLAVGAGPTGLMAANELARRGVAARIVEKRAERSWRSKALVLHARTLEAMDLAERGLSDEFVRRGYAAPGIDLGSDSRRPVRAEMHRLDTRFPYILVVPQAETEEVLENRLAERGVVVERGTELLGFSERDGWVISRVRSPGGDEEEIRSRYLVGCDGAHSTARHALGLPFEGRGYDWTAFLADAKVKGDLAKGGVSQFSSDRGLAFVVPFRDGYFRVVTIDFEHQERTPADDLSLNEMQDSVDAIVPTRPTLKEPRWLTRWGAQLRQIPAYRKSRVFLAGDAAHIHSPVGGQGLNTGVQDAFNLSWKLAFVIRGEAPEALLDTYEAERHPVGRRVLRTSDLILRSLLLRNPGLRAARELLVRALVPLPPIQRRLSENISNIGINYRPTGRTRAPRSGELGRHALRAGDRVPDLELAAPADAKEPSVRLYELLSRDPSYSLFVMASSDGLGREPDGLSRLLRSVEEGYGDAVKARVVLEQGAPEDAAGVGAPVFADFKRRFRHKLGAEHGSVLLVRPDGYLAFHRRGLDPHALASMLDGWIAGRPAADARPRSGLLAAPR